MVRQQAVGAWGKSEQGREPERPTTRVLKSKSFGGRPVTAVVGASGFSSFRAQRDSFVSSAGSVRVSCCASAPVCQLGHSSACSQVVCGEAVLNSRAPRMLGYI
jgi:hypothetical protein